MRPRSLLILFLVVVALGAFIWFVERDLPGTDERAQREKRIVTLEADEINEVTIERDGTRVHLVRPEAAGEEPDADGLDVEPVKRQWRLLEPYDTRADIAKVDRLAETLSLLDWQRALDDVDPAAVGLDAPRAVVTLRTPATEVVLQVGAEIPASSNMIVARDGEVFAAAAAVWSQIETEPGDWRSRELLPLHREAVERVNLTSGPESFVLARREDSFWLEAPLVDLAETERVDELLDAMFRARIDEFYAQPEPGLEEMGLAEPAARLEVSLTGVDEPVVIELGAPSASEPERRYARVDGQLVSIGTELDEAVGRAPAEWQATSWSSLEVFQIDSFRAVDASGELLLERSGADWSRDGVRISYQPVSDFLYALTGAAGERVMAPSEAVASGADLDGPELELSLDGSAGEETLSLYRAGAAVIAGRLGREFLLALSEGTVEDLRVKLQAIRDQPALGDESVDDEEG